MTGAVGSIHSHREIRPIVGRRGRRRCHCGCGKRATHVGCGNGVALMSGCEWSVRVWVRNPDDHDRMLALAGETWKVNQGWHEGYAPCAYCLGQGEYALATSVERILCSACNGFRPDTATERSMNTGSAIRCLNQTDRRHTVTSKVVPLPVGTLIGHMAGGMTVRQALTRVHNAHGQKGVRVVNEWLRHLILDPYRVEPPTSDETGDTQ